MADAVPLTYTLTYTEDDNNGDSTGTATFIIDSSLVTSNQEYFSPSDITNFSATFDNVGGPGNTDSYTQADLESINIQTNDANTPPFDFVYFTTDDTSYFITDEFYDGNDYMFGNEDLGFQTITNDTTDLSVSYSYAISGPAVPEPASLALLSLGAAGLAMVRRPRRR